MVLIIAQSDFNEGGMSTFEEKLTASSADGGVVEVVANVASILGPNGNLVKNIQTVSITVDIPVDDENQFVHPNNGKTYTVNPESL